MAGSLKVLDELGDQFARLAATAPARGPRRRRTTVLAVILAASLSGGALAASGVLTGDPVRNPRGQAFKPDRGLGVPVAGSVRLESIRVPDPAGGPPWGMRTLRTTRGYGCVQVGRVVGDRLGVLGRDGAFGDDGRFHPLPAKVLTQAHCRQRDGAGNAFLAVAYRGLPASGLQGGCAVRPVPGDRAPACDPGALRAVHFGLLGPQGESVGYRDDAGRLATARAAGPDGAYLVVLRPSGSQPADGSFIPTIAPAVGLVDARYAGGRTCRIGSARRQGGARPCRPVGYVDPARARVTPAGVAAPVRARLSGQTLALTFRARVDGDAQRYYAYIVRPDSIRACGFAAVEGQVARDVRAGERVTVRTAIPARCRGLLRGRVVFHSGGREAAPLVSERGDPLVGRFTVRVP